jgi:hypothetical protein
VCDGLRLDCKAGDALTDLIVMKVIEVAKAGEVDPGGILRQGST